jgi:hypothetical protein
MADVTLKSLRNFGILMCVHLQGYNFKVFKIHVVVLWVTTQFYASEGRTMCWQGCPDVRMLTYLGLQSPIALMLVMQKICGSNLG